MYIIFAITAISYSFPTDLGTAWLANKAKGTVVHNTTERLVCKDGYGYGSWIVTRDPYLPVIVMTIIAALGTRRPVPSGSVRKALLPRFPVFIPVFPQETSAPGSPSRFLPLTSCLVSLPQSLPQPLSLQLVCQTQASVSHRLHRSAHPKGFHCLPLMTCHSPSSLSAPHRLASRDTAKFPFAALLARSRLDATRTKDEWLHADRVARLCLPHVVTRKRAWRSRRICALSHCTGRTLYLIYYFRLLFILSPFTLHYDSFPPSFHATVSLASVLTRTIQY